jgi:signal transduction histidine kinase
MKLTHIDRRYWYCIVRHGSIVIVCCCAIAALTNTIWPRGYLRQLGYALSVGTLIWVFVEAGCIMLLRPTDSSTGWPPGIRGILAVIIGIPLGFYFGNWLGYTLFGIDSLISRSAQQITGVVTVVASVLISYFLYTRDERITLIDKTNAAERGAAEAQLKLLATQLEPHMLFNTLANLRALINSDPPRAIAMLDRLDRYLRVTLTGSKALMHPLAAEFDRLADYLALMQVRMGPRLRYTFELPDALRNVPVPPLLLQPLVENAIRHGLEPRAKGGQIEVRAARAGQQLILTVRDTGIGFDTSQPPTRSEGHFGLEQVIERVASAYGDKGHVQVHSQPGAGTTILIPSSGKSAARSNHESQSGNGTLIRITLPLQTDIPCPPP